MISAEGPGFGSLVRSGADAPVRNALENAVKRWGQGAMIVESRGGDALVIVHDDPVALAQTARQIMDEVYQAPGQPRLRLALHHGEVQLRERDLVPIIAGGDAILCAARVEPHVEPGRIWATEDFRRELAQGAANRVSRVVGKNSPT